MLKDRSAYLVGRRPHSRPRPGPGVGTIPAGDDPHCRRRRSRSPGETVLEPYELVFLAYRRLEPQFRAGFSISTAIPSFVRVVITRAWVAPAPPQKCNSSTFEAAAISPRESDQRFLVIKLHAAVLLQLTLFSTPTSARSPSRDHREHALHCRFGIIRAQRIHVAPKKFVSITWRSSFSAKQGLDVLNEGAVGGDDEESRGFPPPRG